MEQEIYMTNKSWLDLCILSGLDPSNKRFNGFDVVTKKSLMQICNVVGFIINMLNKQFDKLLIELNKIVIFVV